MKMDWFVVVVKDKARIAAWSFGNTPGEYGLLPSTIKAPDGGVILAYAPGVGAAVLTHAHALDTLDGKL